MSVLTHNDTDLVIRVYEKVLDVTFDFSLGPPYNRLSLWVKM